MSLGGNLRLEIFWEPIISRVASTLSVFPFTKDFFLGEVSKCKKSMNKVRDISKNIGGCKKNVERCNYSRMKGIRW